MRRESVCSRTRRESELLLVIGAYSKQISKIRRREKVLLLPIDCEPLTRRMQLSSEGRDLSESGGFSTNYYWSSSENDNNNAWTLNFSNGVWNNNNNKNNNYAVRCVRSNTRGIFPSLKIGNIRGKIKRPFDCLDVFKLEDVFAAYYNCRKNKRNKPDQLLFELFLEKNCLELYHQIATKEYRTSPPIVFVVKLPKPREVWAASFRDRVVHHLIYDRIAPWYQRRFIHDSYACIPGRGVHKAVLRAEHFARSVTKNWSQKAYYARFDLANFFQSISLGILWKILERDGILDDPQLRFLLDQIIFNQRRHEALRTSLPKSFAAVPERKSLFFTSVFKGLPIGNLPSQLLANILLNEVDQFSKRVLKCDRYIRYVDDILVFSKDMDFLRYIHQMIGSFVTTRVGAELNENKTKFNELHKGMDVFGYYILPGRRYIRHETYSRITPRIIKLEALSRNGDKVATAGLASYKGIFGFTDTRWVTESTI